MRRAGVWTATAAAAVLAVGLAGCSDGSSAGGASGSTSASASGGPTGSITVFAAASLQQTFTELGRRYERAHPGTTVRFSFAGSSDLVTQIQNGAPADVFASADEATMAELGSGDLRGTPADFATNVLQIAVAPGNPEGVRDLADLGAPGLQVVTCAEPVPCGAATAQVERAAGVTLHPVSEEQSVTDVRGAAGKVDGVSFAASSKAVNTYPIAVLRESRDTALAESFSSYVRSAAGRRVLTAAGFGAP